MKKELKYFLLATIAIPILISCEKKEVVVEEESAEVETTVETRSSEPSKIPVLFDSDANNELDDQHAMAYLFFNDDIFDVVGVTVNATVSGGEIANHYKEAERVMKLCNVMDKYPLLSGANGDFEEIYPNINEASYDGKEAVDFIIAEARKPRARKLVLMPVGKLTNIALALAIAPDIKDKVRIVWLGANYPDSGEYNLDNDIFSVNYVIEQKVPLEIVLVRYGKPTATDAVRVTPDEVKEKMAGMGPKGSEIKGRHGGTFTYFGDYAINLFENIHLDGDIPSRALFDMVAVAILKNPAWGETKEIPAPFLIGNQWVDRSDNTRKVVLWENFDKDAILADFFNVMQTAK